MRPNVLTAMALLLCLSACYCLPDPGDKVLSLSYFHDCWDTAAHGKN